MYIRSAMAAALVAIQLAGIPLSADYSGARYQGDVLITNAGGAAERTAVYLDANTSGFISDGFLASDYSNAWLTNAAGNGMAWMPVPGTDDLAFFYPWSLPATSSALSYLYMGGPDEVMDPPIRYFPGAGGMTTPDNASMEPGSNFEIEIQGYLDPSVTGALVYKEGAFCAATVAPDELLVGRLQWIWGVLRPTSHTTNWWSNPANAYDGNTGTCAHKYTESQEWSTYLKLHRDSTPVSSVSLKYSITTSWDVTLELYYGGEWNLEYSAAESGTEATWITVDLDPVQDVTSMRFRGYNKHDYAMRAIEVRDAYWIPSEYEPVWNESYPLLSATVTPGLRTIEVQADGTDTSLTVDGVLQDSAALGDSSVPNTSTDWIIAVGGSVLYIEYYKHTVGGVLRQHIEWEDAATFTDLSGNGNDATPTFPVASSNPDVTAALIAFEPFASADAPSGSATDPGGLAGDLPDEPSRLYAELDVDHIPGAMVVNALLDAGDIPQALFWFPATFVGIAILCLIVYRYSRSLFAMSLVAGAGLLFASRIGIVPFWVTVPLILIAVAILVKEKMSPL